MRTLSSQNSSRSGLTLIEVTLVLSILLSLIAITFFGVNAYKKGTDRAACIQNIASAQRAIRAYSHFYDAQPGKTVDSLTDRLIGSGKFLPIVPICPAGGTYTFSDGGNKIPEFGTTFLTCSIGNHEHPDNPIW